MAAFLIYRKKTDEHLRNAGGINAVLVSAADEATARSTAQAAAPRGEVKIHAGWSAVQISTSNLPAGLDPVTFVEGDVVPPGSLFRGGGTA